MLRKTKRADKYQYMALLQIRNTPSQDMGSARKDAWDSKLLEVPAPSAKQETELNAHYLPPLKNTEVVRVKLI